ncbi:threonine/serine ThrE exporter family protein [Atopobacter phocae]|uniref:threonine/serine ThrE exporter family protein n=1 Tax=Atopobacter phocae TaxID=136492 RepID=UPI00046F8A0F|nr:threonine/serine exporter family protein [Atopobacter phocae]
MTPKKVKKLVDTAVLAGQMLVENNAETYRAEETMYYILSTSHFEVIEINAIGSAVYLTIDDPSIASISMMKRVKRRDTNLSKIEKINSISRRLVKNEITVDQAYDLLKQADKSELPQWLKELGNLLLMGGLAMMFSGQINEALVAIPVGVWFVFMNYIDRHIDLGFFVNTVLSVFLMTTSIILIHHHVYNHFNVNLTIIGVIMPLVPGTPITNAIRDAFRGDYLSASVRALEAFLIAVSVALGVALAFLLMGG